MLGPLKVTTPQATSTVPPFGKVQPGDKDLCMSIYSVS